MRRSCLIGALVIALCTIGASQASAQFTVKAMDVGPVIGLGNIGGAGIAFGGRFEKGFKELPNLGNGVLGIGVGVDYYHWGDNAFGTDFGWTVIPISVTANYHFNLKNKKIDPFLGAGLGYEHWGSSGSCNAFGVDCGGSSGIYFVGHAGIRYYLQPKMALYADAGAGAGSLHVGLMFNLAGK